MKAGDLKHRITIEKLESVTDSRGNRVKQWVPLCSCMASMQDVSGRDFYAAQSFQAQDTVTFGIRWRDDVTTEHRVNRDGVIYTISEVNHLGYKRDYMHLKTKQTRGEGG